MLNLVMVGLDAVTHSFDIGTVHDICTALDFVGGEAVMDLGSHAVLHVVAVLDGIRNQMVLYDGVDAVVDVRTAVLNLGLHTAVHVGAVLDLIGGEVVLNQGINGDVSG